MKAVVEQYPLIPQEAFLFFPSEQQTVQVRNKKPYRILFEGGVVLTNFEKQQLALLHAELRRDSKYHRLTFFAESILLRFLQATKYDCDDCISELKKYKKWEDHTIPLTLRPEIERILKSGLFYLTGRDINYRPVLVVNVARIMQLDLKQKVFQQAAGYFFQYIVQNCMIEGQVQTWITIVDLGKMGMFSMAGTVIDTISFLSSHFRCRLHHSYLVNCPGSISFLFGMVKRAMSQDQIMKISLVEDGALPQTAFANVFEDEIEVKYGGTHENYTEFWPCRMKRRVVSQEQNSRLISVEQYAEMYSKGLLRKKKVNRQLLSLHQYQVSERELQTEHKPRMVEESEQEQLSINADIWTEDQPPTIPSLPLPIDIDSLFGFLNRA